MTMSTLEETTLSHAILEEQRRYIDYFFERIDGQALDRCIELLANSERMVFATGVGKSSFLAKKFVGMLASIGYRVSFLSPLDALHGDLGSVNQGDLIFFFSKSGESDELLSLIPFIRKKGGKIISIVCHVASRLVRASDSYVELPLQRELCPYDLAPTTSTVLQEIFTSCIIVALMRKKRLTLADYALNHPAGRIGKRITLLVSDLMVRGEELPIVKGATRLQESLALFSQKAVGCLLVVNDHGVLVGIFTDGDLRRALERFGKDVLDHTLEQLMTTSPRVTFPHLLAIEAMREMERLRERAITVLPVVEGEGVLVGLIRMHDIIQSGL